MLLLISMYEDWAPIEPIFTLNLAKALSWNRVEAAIRLLTVGYPLLWQPAVVLCVIEGLKGKPVSGSRHWIPIVNALNSNSLDFSLF